MALKQLSSFLYGYTVTTSNQNLDFLTSLGGTQLTAVLRPGSYGLTELLAEVVRAMQAADLYNTYTATADHTISGGTQNRVTIATAGTYLSLLFSSGTNAATS